MGILFKYLKLKLSIAVVAALRKARIKRAKSQLLRANS